MSNINTVTRRRQWLIAGGALAAMTVTGGGIWFYNQHQAALKHQAAHKPADLTGSGLVTPTFTDAVTTSVLAQQQNKTAGLEQGLKDLNTKVDSQAASLDRKLEQITAALDKLQSQGTHAATQPGASGTPSAPGAGQNGPVPLGPAGPAQWHITDPAGGPASGQGSRFYPGQAQGTLPAAAASQTGGLMRKTFTYASLSRKWPHLPWISSGSFSQAVMIEGADANASVTGQQNTTPVVLTLIGDVSMPNGKTYNLDQCRVTGEIYGDISSERGEVRTKNISCNLKNGDHIDMPFEGHVAYQGKQGIRGKPVMRNGQILWNAGGAGFLSGLGDGFKSAATPMVGLGGATTIGAGDILKQGFGGGASKAADTLSQYYIKRAEQYHPVIDIGAGNAVTVVFQQGFRLKTIEEQEAEKDRQNNSQVQVQETAANTPAVNASGTRPAVLDPNEVLKQASQLRLGDTIN
ncbi:F-type conjugal transfer pilus assembly protein TraB (plasmid) [Pantoea sp. JZ29]|uniref:F-type conjugal transfer pilus assembly protein TraB n=1 Tax=Pantoea sp. JZ29 TaxID=2654192 RepID=UPI002B467723|nr:F-type conjugal transfer pilus assembly protein TraB [Pantoea sp. JZ29]WRH23435.1 F-type conjugal transfer pilus assembly protein TraB [Pantoea sp. JZ29]